MDRGAADAGDSDGKAALRAALEARGSEGMAASALRRGRGPSHRGFLCAASVMALVFVAGWLLTERPRPVTLVRVSAGEVTAPTSARLFSASGHLVPAEKIVGIGSRIPGRVARLLAEEGDFVLAGQALVELDDRPFVRAFEEAEERVRSSRARFTLMRREVARARSLVRQGALPPRELDERESEERSAAAALSEAQAAFVAAKLDLNDTLVRAPVSGIVVATLRRPGESVVPGDLAERGELLRVANMEDAHAAVDVNEGDLTRLWIGQRAEVTPDTLPEVHLAATVVTIEPQGDRQKAASRVEVRLDEGDRRLSPAMRARVSFLADGGLASSRGPAVVLPLAAVRRGADDRTYVWVVSDGRARRRFIETADLVGKDVRAVDGLVGGEEVVVGAPPEADGERVTSAER